MGERHGHGRDEQDRSHEARAAELRRCGARTRDLLDDLEAAKPDLLSVADLNRALKQVLRNQAAILDALAASPTASQAASRPAPRAGASSSSIAVRPRSSGPARRALPDDDEVLGWTPRKQPVDGAPDEPLPAPVEPDEDEPAPTDTPAPTNGTHAPPAAHLPENGPTNGTHPIGAVLPTARVTAELLIPLDQLVPGGAARVLVELFDNRDKDYEKGLDKLNRWSAGGAGTPFQLRGDRAYLNLDATGPESARSYEEQLMTRMGFSRRLGRLQVPGLQGVIVVYERPSS